MTMPQFSAGLSLYKSKSSYRRGRSTTPVDGAVAPAGAVAECACCILTDRYSCCAACADAILDQF